jgi:hypothetical protein
VVFQSPQAYAEIIRELVHDHFFLHSFQFVNLHSMVYSLDSDKKTNVSLYLIKHHSMETDGGVEA